MGKPTRNLPKGAGWKSIRERDCVYVCFSLLTTPRLLLGNNKEVDKVAFDSEGCNKKAVYRRRIFVEKSKK